VLCSLFVLASRISLTTFRTQSSEIEGCLFVSSSSFVFAFNSKLTLPPPSDMLVYTRRDSPASPAASTSSSAAQPASTAIGPPPLALQTVEVLDAKYKVEMEEFAAKYVFSSSSPSLPPSKES
jgi:hypothetical protein